MGDEEAMLDKMNHTIATGETLSQLLYNKLDQDRHTIDKLYPKDSKCLNCPHIIVPFLA